MKRGWGATDAHEGGRGGEVQTEELEGRVGEGESK